MKEIIRGLTVSRRSFLKKTAALTAAGSALLTGGLVGAQTAPNGKPRRGGRLVVGVTGGGAKDKLDAHTPISLPDTARVHNLYDRLAIRNENFDLELALAEEVTPSSDASKWTIRLKQGVTFHNGKDITADDVIFTFQRILDKAAPKNEARSISFVDPNGFRKLDARTVEVNLLWPSGILLDALSGYAFGIVPVGYDPANPVGSGPFKLKSFTAGDKSIFTRFDGYWRPDQPYLDEVVIIDFPDESARINALLGGQVDAIDQVPLGQIPIVEGNSALRVLDSPTGSWLPFTMRVDAPPFNDVRVRQAFRLIVDRKEMIRQALAGRGRIGNDIYSPFDPCYPSDFPQRDQDIDQAKSLLRQAGHQDLEVELVSSPVGAGLVEAAQVFTKQAESAGVKVRLNRKDAGQFYGKEWLSYPFSQAVWYTRSYLLQAGRCALPQSPFNETHWTDPAYARLIQEAIATIDDKKRCEIIHQAQKLEWDNGGYLIWGFPNQVGAYSARVSGFKPDKTGAPMNSYGFGKVWFNA